MADEFVNVCNCYVHAFTCTLYAHTCTYINIYLHACLIVNLHSHEMYLLHLISLEFQFDTPLVSPPCAPSQIMFLEQSLKEQSQKEQPDPSEVDELRRARNGQSEITSMPPLRL